MSYYLSDKLVRTWAENNLNRYLDPREYKLIFDRLRSQKRSERLTRVELGLLKLMLDEYRPERSEQERKRYAESNAVKIVDIADTLGCHTSTVSRSKNHLNDLAARSARHGREAKKNGLILFHDLGVCIQATFWDAIRAKDYSEKQISGQVPAHTANISLADEKHHGLKVREEHARQFSALTPAEQERLLRMAGVAMASARADDSSEKDPK